MRKLLKILIICFILIIIVILILLNKYSKDTKMKNSSTNIIQQTEPIHTSDEIIDNTKEDTIYNNNNQKGFETLKNRKHYIIIEDIVINILNDMRICNSDQLIKSEYKIEDKNLINDKKREIFKELEDRINDNSNLEELFNSDIFKNIIIKEGYYINKIYQKEINSNIIAFLVYGQFSNSNTEYAFMVIFDNSKNVYEVYLNDYIEEKNYELNNLNNINVELDAINKNENNIIKKYEDQEVNEEIAKRYLIITKTKLENNPEEVYNMLDNAYKKKFSNLDSFKEFAKNAQLSQLKEYRIINKDQYSEVICRDELGNCILFKEKAVMDYTIVLDPYTIEIDTLISEYNTVDKERVELNIQKIAQMINMRDYEEIYKRLNETFKNNNFPSINDLKNYIKSNFYERSKIEFIAVEDNDTYYAIRVRIINEANQNQRKLGTIIIKLGEGTNFEMSFSVD